MSKAYNILLKKIQLKKREMLIDYYRALETSMKKQSEIQLAKEEWKNLNKKFHEERAKSVIADFKIRKKDISRQLDLLEKNVIDDDEDKQRKTKKMLDLLMHKLIHEDFINKTYSVPSRSKMRPALGKYLEATREERTKKLKLFAKQRNVEFID